MDMDGCNNGEGRTQDISDGIPERRSKDMPSCRVPREGGDKDGDARALLEKARARYCNNPRRGKPSSPSMRELRHVGAVAPVKGPPRHQHVAVLASRVWKVSLFEDDNSISHVPSPEVHAHRRPRPCPPWAPFNWACLCSSFREFHRICPGFSPPRCCIRPCPISLPCLPMLGHAV